MNNNYKKMKLIIFIGIICIFAIIAIAIYMFFPQKASVSIYQNENVVNLEKDGIKTEEFNKFLEVVSLLVNEEYEDTYGSEEIENIRMLDTSISFVHSFSEETPTATVDGNYEYDAEMINTIIKEIKGINIDKNIPVGVKYKYDETKNIYNVSENNTISACEVIEIEEFEKKGSKIELKYKCYIGEKSSVYEIKAILVENSEYKYSKYFVNTIEKVSQ